MLLQHVKMQKQIGQKTIGLVCSQNCVKNTIEVIYIIKGEGIVHYDDKQTTIKEGNSVYLPPGTMHRLENKNPKLELELLGVFCPAGSPADKKEKPNES